jgi:2-phosphoglycerate kinase
MAKKKAEIAIPLDDLAAVAENKVAEVTEALEAGPISSIKNILFRIIAVFAASGLSVIGAGAVVGISTVKAVILAGTLGVANVVEKLARGFLNDGKLDANEINDAFNSVDKKAQN